MLQAGDIFVLPTYREGFGSSVIEASALELPVICSDAYGVMDAMVDNLTGLRCKVGDVDSLYKAMTRLAEDKQLQKSLGKNGRERVVNEFSGADVTKHWLQYYADVVK
jgi:glycosyltransferase involved in cell wall biosynthesis